MRANGIAYRGINVLMLWAEAESKGYSALIWMTFKQAIDLGAFLKGYTVFNVEQVEGLPVRFYATATKPLDPAQRMAHAETFFAATGAIVGHGGNRAFYSVSEDRI